MPTIINGTTGIDKVQDGSIAADDLGSGVVTADKLASTLDLTGKTVTLPAGTGGKVLQVVSVAQTTSFSTTSGTYTDIGLSASITPTSASNKIFIIANYLLETQVSNLSVHSTIYRNSTDLGLTSGHYGSSAGWLATTVVAAKLDSPSSTSSITYSIKARVTYGSGTIASNSPATITLMEIAA